MKKYAKISILVLTVLFMGMENAGWSTILETKFDRHIVKEAELIFQGVVQKVQYKSSIPPSKETIGIPHTFVTFEVERIIKGDIRSGSTITLRFEGGIAQDGKVLIVDGIPLFDKEEHFILFIKGNTTSPCPLVGWNQGIFRVINRTDVYSEGGNKIVLADRLADISQFAKSDFLDPAQFIARLADPKSETDRIIRSGLEKNTLDVLSQTESRQYPLMNILLNYLIRDMNDMITRKDLFSEAVVDSLLLREETRDNWKINREQTDPFKISRVNRQLLEDAYPASIVKTPNQMLAWGTYEVLDEVIVHAFNEELKTRLGGKEEFENDQPQIYLEGKNMTLEDVTAQLLRLVQILHTPEELKATPLVPSADIGQDFNGQYFEPAIPPRDYGGKLE